MQNHFTLVQSVSTSTSLTRTTAGTRGAPSPGHCGRRSCRSAARAATSEFAPTCGRNASHLDRFPPGRRPLERSPDGFCDTSKASRRANSYGSRPWRLTARTWNALTGRARSFAQMLTEPEGQRLPEWLDAVRQDDLPTLHTLAACIERDRDAVIAGRTLLWSSGVVEGHVNRIKMLKRQMFGRAGLDYYCGRGCLAAS
ncbi:transposase [Streptomyces sp. I8-5]|uniref:transposase n=1 Tax=Streptomyces sp. I8-5 TaxID=3104277 RepID=UPI00386EAFED